MRRFACLLVSMAALLLLPQWLRAQSATILPRLLVGVTGGYNLVAYNTNEFPTLNSVPFYYIVENGSGHGSYFGVTSELPLSSGMQNFVVLDVSYDSKPSRFTSLTAAAALIGQYDTGYSLSADLSYYLLSLGYKFNFWHGTVPNGLGIQVCASLGLIAQKSFNRTTYLYDSSNGGHGGTLEESFSIPNVDRFRFAVRTELTYDVPLFSKVILTPSVGYDAPITKVDPSLNWTANSLYFGLAVQYMFQ